MSADLHKNNTPTSQFTGHRVSFKRERVAHSIKRVCITQIYNYSGCSFPSLRYSEGTIYNTEGYQNIVSYPACAKVLIALEIQPIVKEIHSMSWLKATYERVLGRHICTAVTEIARQNLNTYVYRPLSGVLFVASAMGAVCF